MTQAQCDKRPARKTELASLREALGTNATNMLLYIFQAGGWIDGITPTRMHVSQGIIENARKKLEGYGLIRTTRRPGRSNDYQIIDKEDLPMLIEAWEQWVDEREKARTRKAEVGAA